VAILQRHDVRHDPIAIARKVTAGIRNKKSGGGREIAAHDDAELRAQRRR